MSCGDLASKMFDTYFIMPKQYLLNVYGNKLPMTVIVLCSAISQLTQVITTCGSLRHTKVHIQKKVIVESVAILLNIGC